MLKEVGLEMSASTLAVRSNTSSFFQRFKATACLLFHLNLGFRSLTGKWNADNSQKSGLRQYFAVRGP